MTRDLDDALRETPNATLYILRDDLRRVLIHDRADRDAIASQLLRYRDMIDMLTMYPDARRQVARLLGKIEAGDSGSSGTVTGRARARGLCCPSTRSVGH